MQGPFYYVLKENQIGQPPFFIIVNQIRLASKTELPHQQQQRREKEILIVGRWVKEFKIKTLIKLATQPTLRDGREWRRLFELYEQTSS